MKTSAFLSPTQLKVWKKKKGFANLMWSIWCSTIGNISVWPPVTLQHPVRTWTNIWKYLKTYISYALLLFLIGNIDIWICRLNHDYNDQYWRRHRVCLDFLFVYLSICLANLSNLSVFPNTGVPHSSYQCLQYIIFIIWYMQPSLSPANSSVFEQMNCIHVQVLLM